MPRSNLAHPSQGPGRQSSFGGGIDVLFQEKVADLAQGCQDVVAADIRPGPGSEGPRQKNEEEETPQAGAPGPRRRAG